MLPSDPLHNGVGNAALIENLLTVLIYIHLITHWGENGNELAGGLSDIKGTWKNGCLLLIHTEIGKILQNTSMHISEIYALKNSDQHSIHNLEIII